MTQHNNMRKPHGVRRRDAESRSGWWGGLGRRSAAALIALLGLCLNGRTGSPAAADTAVAVPESLRQPGLAKLKPLPCRFVRVPDRYHTDKSGYTAFVMGPDGRIYLGTARYYDYGYWLAYEPKERSFHPVVDMRITLGEDLYDVNTQGKTHTRLAVGPDGRIYGGTKQGHELFRTRPEIGEQPGGYPGGHLVAHDPATGVTEDLGVLRPQDGLMNGVIDPRLRRIYLKTEPRTHFLIYEIDTHQVIDKGRVGTWSRYIDMDGEGNVWIPNDGSVTKYDAVTDELIDYNVVVEGDGPPYQKPYACVIGGQAGQRGMKLYGGDNTRIQQFDLQRAADGVLPMRYICRSVPEPYENSTDIHTMIRDEKGRIYWSAPVPGDAKPLLIMRYDPGQGEAECLGYTVDTEYDKHEDAQKGIGSIQGSALANDGTLYLMGTYPYYILEYPRLAAD